jgi:hypothetical protein
MSETMIYKKKLMKKVPMTNICEGCDVGKSPECTYIDCAGVVWKEVKTKYWVWFFGIKVRVSYKIYKLAESKGWDKEFKKI